MALTLYSHPLSSCCHKVLVALYEAGTPFENHLLNLGDPAARAAFAAMWATAKIPLLADGEKIVPETSIIIEYLDQHYPGPSPLLPKDEAARLDARLWDRVFDLYVMTPMQKIVAEHMRPVAERDAGTLDALRAVHATAYDMIEDRMSARTWLAGEAFSIADCSAAPALFYASITTPFPPTHANLAAYFERLMARPSVRRVIDEARPFFDYFPMKDAMPKRFLEAAA